METYRFRFEIDYLQKVNDNGVPFRRGTGKPIELTLEADFEIEPFVPGRINARPEDCYPDEGGYAELSGSLYLVKESGKLEPWNQELSNEQLEKVERCAYNSWERENYLEQADSYYQKEDADDFDNYSETEFYPKLALINASSRFDF